MGIENDAGSTPRSERVEHDFPAEVREALERLRRQASAVPGGAMRVEAQSERELFDQLPSEVRDALQTLRRKSGAQIAKRLQEDKRLADRYMRDPVGALREMGVDVPRSLRKLGVPKVSLADALKAQTIRVPGGQTITPRVRIRFTDG